MVALQIRDVPEEVRDVLAAQAKACGKSLQGFLLELITEEARRVRNADVLARFARRNDGARGSDITADLAEARAERELQ
ncbi:hypothetical protein [Sinosporangium siamense]|uniref:Uncharacterized protein n=1 Tax=Sinosporangium siamense TaxID=1367973 RepID=A0A919RLY8_9ACTN|nr:hypothetical protein [Sinosporangium siamense]GII96235.1 hypothetical protein Ssi02_64660 [Sinosporangium siamense]